MQTQRKILAGAAVIVAGVVVPLSFLMMGMAFSPKVFADCNGVETSVLGENGCVEGTDDGSAIFSVLNVVLTVLTYGVGIAGTIGIVIVGIQLLTAKDNAAQYAAAKTRFIAIVIGLAAYAVMWGFLQWLLPGGIFGNS